MFEKGLPSFYLTINPADIYDPIVKFLGGDDFDVDEITPENVPQYWEQSSLVANNPVVCAKFFHIYVDTFLGPF